MNLPSELLGGSKPTDYVRLLVNGDAYAGFESGSVQLTMREGASTFDLDYIGDGSNSDQRAIFRGDEIEIAIDSGGGPETILAGYVVTTDESDDEGGLRLHVSGYSRAGDLIDCSALNAPRSWKNATLEKIALDLCLPFAVDVYVEGDQGAPFASFSLQDDEHVFDAISRAALLRGLFPYSVGGDLILAQAGQTQTRTVLERGKRLIRSSRTDSDAGRYSDYVFRAQARPTDNNFGAKAAHLRESYEDAGVSRHRPLLVHAEAHDKIGLRTRAQLECNQRAGNGETITALVDGWATDEGPAWRPNTLVRVTNAVLGVDADMLITVVRFAFGPTVGREVELQLTRPDAFSLARYPVLERGETWT